MLSFLKANFKFYFASLNDTIPEYKYIHFKNIFKMNMCMLRQVSVIEVSSAEIYKIYCNVQNNNKF